jgi:hypothetical protein
MPAWSLDRPFDSPCELAQGGLLTSSFTFILFLAGKKHLRLVLDCPEKVSRKFTVSLTTDKYSQLRRTVTRWRSHDRVDD